jgi:hypothetical protein
LRTHLPWLCQGDIFRDVPVIDVTLADPSRVEVISRSGPAVLLTHDCAMDKPNRRGEPRVERLQFARLRSIDALPPDKQGSLRGSATSSGPFDVLYVGEISDLGESFILLSDPYYLPAAYFALRFDDYTGHPDAGAGSATYAAPGAHDTRLGRLDQAQMDLLRVKMLAFWARVQQE